MIIEKPRQSNDVIPNSQSPAAWQRAKSWEETLRQPQATCTAVSSQGDTLCISENGRNASLDRNLLRESQNEADGKVIRKNKTLEGI